MSSMWRRAMLFLGLGPDEEYDYEDSGYGAFHDEVHDRGGPSNAYPNQRSTGPDASDPSVMGSVRPLTRDPYHPGPAVTVMAGPSGEVRGTGTVRPVAAPVNAKPHTVCPDTFNEVQEIADRFMTGTPVIMNLQGVDRDLSRRFVDFASGMCYGLSGQMERVANHVYLLTPSNVEVSTEDRRHLQERNA